MKATAARGILFVFVAGGLGFAAAHHLHGGGDERKAYQRGKEASAARRMAVDNASAVGIAGSHFLAARTLGHVFGAWAQAGPLVTDVFTLRRRLDLSDVAMDDRRGGPVEALLALAQAQAEALDSAGFDTMGAEWGALGLEKKERIEDPLDGTPTPPPAPVPGAPRLRPIARVDVHHESDSGGGGGVTWVDLNAPRIAHVRIYVVPRSGATLFVRNVYDQDTKVIDSELFYADRTHFGVEYSTGSYLVGRRPGGYRVFERVLPSN